MKPKSNLCLSLPLASAIAALLAAPVAHATSLTWDADGLPPDPTDGLGIWLDPNLRHLIEASNTLADWGTPVVSEVTGADATAIQSGLPAPDAGWTYHTFRTDDDAASDGSDFIRAKVTNP